MQIMLGLSNISSGCNVICVMVDRLTESVNLILMNMEYLSNLHNMFDVL